MAKAPSKPSPRGASSKKDRAENTPAVKLTEMLASEGGPWRPFNETGVLVKAQKAPRDTKAIFAACERRLLSHLEAVCLWPEDGRNESWRVGDYSFYILFFDPAPKTELYAQFWSEPDEGGAIFEVSSGAWNPPADEYVNAQKQELLRDHAFEIGGNANNFRKIVTVENRKDLRAVAREAVALLCNVFGYDGKYDLGYRISLQTASVLRYVLMEISPNTLVKLLHEWGFVAKLKADKNEPPLIDAQTDRGQFGVLFGDETKEGSRRYLAITLRTFLTIQDRAAWEVVRHINEILPTVTATVDGDGDVMLQTQVLLHGGVTSEHMRTRFDLWRRVTGDLAKWKK